MNLISNSKEPLFLGKFKDRAAALKLRNDFLIDKSPVEAYTTQRWLSRQEFFLELARKGQCPRQTSLLELSTMLTNGIKSILDFGGGSGWLYEAIKINPNWQHLEKYAVFEINAVSEYFSNRNKTRYVSLQELFEAKERFDCVYLNSVIQYCDHLDDLGSILDIVKPNFLVIDEVTLSNEEMFYTLQTYYDNYLLVHFNDENKFISYFSSKNFSLIKKQNISPILNEKFTWQISSNNILIDATLPYNLLFQKLEIGSI